MSPSPVMDSNEVPRTPKRSEKSYKASSTPTPAPRNAQKMATPASRKPPKLGLPKSAPKKVSSDTAVPASPSATGRNNKQKAEIAANETSSQPREKIAMRDNEEQRSAEPNDDNENSSAVDATDLEEAGAEPMQEQNDEDIGVANGRTSGNDANEDDDVSLDNDIEQSTESEDDSAGRRGTQKPSAGTESNDNEVAEGKAKMSQKNNITSATIRGSHDRALGPENQGARNARNMAPDVSDDTQQVVNNTVGKVSNSQEKVNDSSQDGAKRAEKAANEAQQMTADNVDAAKDKVNQSVDDVGNADKTGGEEAKGRIGQDNVSDASGVQDQTGRAKKAADNVKEKTNDAASDLKETAGKAGKDIKGSGEEATREVEDKVDSGTEDVTESIDNGDIDGIDDIASLKGLKVQENGEILDSTGYVIGKLEEGDPTDLDGYEIGDNGEILDEEGDVVGRASLFNKDQKEGAKEVTSHAKDAVAAADDELGDAVETYLPDLDVLKGLEVQKNGDILGTDGAAIGRITEGDPADLVGMILNEDGEVLDEDNDVVGRAETVRQEVKKETHDKLGLDALDGLEVNKDGTIKDKQGNVLGNITEGDPQDLVGSKLNADGKVLDDEGDVIGRAEIVSDATQAVKDQKDEIESDANDGSPVKDLENQLKPNLDIVEGRKLNKKGNVLDDEGDILASLVDGDARACAGKLPNQRGEVLDDDGNVIGKVEVVTGEAADQAMKDAHPEIVKELEEAKKAATETTSTENEVKGETSEAEQADDDLASDLSQLQGLTVNKKGEVVNQDGDVIARLTEGELDKVYRRKINEKGEIVDKAGNFLGRVGLIDEAKDHDNQNDRNAEEDPDVIDTSFLEGYKVNKSGNVLNEDGSVIARLAQGNLDDVVGKRLNNKGEVVDNNENVLGKVEVVREGDGDAEAQADHNMPPLSSLQGLKVNKSGKMIDDKGNVVGELVEGDSKKLWKLAASADEEGQFWDKGRLIGRAKTVAIEEETEGEFVGLEGLVVIKDGWVEDENGNKVGKIVNGDAKKLIGRAVDEDGDIVDKKGNAVGHAERYEEPDEEKPAPVDLSELRGLTCNKQGNVIGPDGVPIGRLVEGNPKELAGRKMDEKGQIWNDAGKVVGTCEIIPSSEREARAEGPFAGLEGLVVVQDGFVQDSDSNNVGQLVEGNPKKLVGRAVDEDGEIVDKYGNVKGRAVPYDEPEQEPEDLSSLAGTTVNKRGKVVDEHGTIFGEVVDGSPERLAGCKVDGQGQIWSNDGKVIGKARVISGGDDGRAEGPFSNFESTTVGKDGVVKDNAGEVVGRVVEGDPKQLVGRHVDDNGDIVDKNGNVIGKAERWEPEEKPRETNAMAGLRVNREGEVRDKNGDTIGKLTEGNLLHCIGREINDNGYVMDQDGNKLGEVTLIENIQEEEEEEPEPGMTDEEAKAAEERQIAKKIANVIFQTIDKMEPICKQIEEAVEKADRTPREELDEEALVNQVKPLIEEGGRILNECNGSIRGLDPDGHVAAQAKSKHASGEASPEENRVAEGLKELTGNIIKCIDNAKKKIADMPHAKKKLSPLWALLTEPLFQIIAAVGLLLSGVLGLVGKLLNGLGLGGLVNGLLGGLGINKILDGVGLGSITQSLGLGGGKKK